MREQERTPGQRNGLPGLNASASLLFVAFFAFSMNQSEFSGVFAWHYFSGLQIDRRGAIAKPAFGRR